VKFARALNRALRQLNPDGVESTRCRFRDKISLAAPGIDDRARSYAGGLKLLPEKLQTGGCERIAFRRRVLTLPVILVVVLQSALGPSRALDGCPFCHSFQPVVHG
jgi:hypothetical protein